MGVGEDCSIFDCPEQCSGHGSCLLEYPVGRCQCEAGFGGPACKSQKCINNCSYPNGDCNFATGICECRFMKDPYNNTRDYKQYGGNDCSYMLPYMASPLTEPTGIILAALVAHVFF